MNEQQRQSLPGDATETVIDPYATQKTAAARAAVADIPDGAVIGLGSGTTAEAMLRELAARMQQGLRVTGVPTSERTARIAASLGIPLAGLDDVPALTASIDGADEVLLPQLHLIKGRGGALLREKLIAAASQYRIIIADSRKLVSALGGTYAVPVEIIPFGWRHIAARLASLGCQTTLRMAQAMPAGATPGPYITDSGNYILDCHLPAGALAQPEAVAADIKSVVGVVEHGLFLAMTERVFVAGTDGVQVYDRPR